MLIIFGEQNRKKLDANDYTFGHLILILSLHYLVKCEMQVVKLAVCEWCQCLPLAFAMEEDILSTYCNKKDVI